jgi:hypothetical protein
MIVWLGSVLFFAVYITVLIITHIKGGAYADELLKNTAAGILEATPSLVFETKHIREMLKDHYADVSSMFWIGLPPVVTALLAAFLFHNRDWTRSQMYAGDVPNLNATLSCYLQPAGIIYAILFGFSYRVVSQRRRKFTQVLCEGMLVLMYTVACHATTYTVHSTLARFQSPEQNMHCRG